MIPFQIMAGAFLGAAVGFLVGRARVCSSARCNVKANMILSVVAGAFFGAAVAWYYVTK